MLSEDRAGEEGKGRSLPADLLQAELQESVPRVWLTANSEEKERESERERVLVSAVHPESYLKAVLNLHPQKREGPRSRGFIAPGG